MLCWVICFSTTTWNGLVLGRFYAVLEDIKEFLSTSSDQKVAKRHLGFLIDVEENVASIAFLTDLFRNLNLLNFKLQGKGKRVWTYFRNKKLFKKDWPLLWKYQQKTFTHLKSVCDTNETIDISQFEDFLEKLKFVFQEIFPDFEKIENIVQLVNNSFSLMPDGIWASEVANVLKSNKSAVQFEISEF